MRQATQYYYANLTILRRYSQHIRMLLEDRYCTQIFEVTLTKILKSNLLNKLWSNEISRKSENNLFCAYYSINYSDFAKRGDEAPYNVLTNSEIPLFDHEGCKDNQDRSQSGALESDRSRSETCNNLAIRLILHEKFRKDSTRFTFSLKPHKLDISFTQNSYTETMECSIYMSSWKLEKIGMEEEEKGEETISDTSSVCFRSANIVRLSCESGAIFAERVWRNQIYARHCWKI